MLDYFGIFTRGGALLWTLQFTALRHNPVEALSALVRSCLLEERLSDTAFTYTPKQGAAQTLKWTFHNGLGLVFVAVYQKTLSLLYVEELLQLVKAEFASEYKPHVYSYRKFDDTFKRLLSEAEQRSEEAKRPALTMRPGASNAAAAAAKVAAKKGGQHGSGAVGGQKSSAPSGGSEDGAEDDGQLRREASSSSRGRTADGHRVSNGVDSALSDRSTGQDDTDTNTESDGGIVGKSAFDVSKLPKGTRAGGRAGIPAGPRRRVGSTSAPAATNGKDEAKGAKADAAKKKPRNWNVVGKNEGAPAKLDYTDYGGAANGEQQHQMDADAAARGAGAGVVQSRMDRDEEDEYEEEELDDVPVQPGAPSTQAAAVAAGEGKKGLLASFMSSLALRVVGSAALLLEDLEPALVDMKRKLMERNVAEEIAQQICNSVGKRLEGQKLSSFTGVSSFVSSAFEESLEGILNKRQVDVLLDIQRSQARQKPYVIVFCGVNGVGKSTNLAKIAYWLLQHNIKVTIAACDTFRAGAVEQLKTHCARLGVPLYERGYEKDPAKVAAEAIRQAERDGNHVVLVDTAGRMQDNEPLMRALSTLINMNEPNLVLFVGEALVGNDAVDQLSKFNRALADLAPPGCTRKRLVDGIVLTKFDTIDDKVGAALSMVYTAGAPVMFVGCGQTYVDLKKLNIKSVVRSLLK